MTGLTSYQYPASMRFTRIKGRKEFYILSGSTLVSSLDNRLFQLLNHGEESVPERKLLRGRRARVRRRLYQSKPGLTTADSAVEKREPQTEIVDEREENAWRQSEAHQLREPEERCTALEASGAMRSHGAHPGSSHLSFADNPSTPVTVRLINGAFHPHEVITLIETIFASKDEIQMIRNLHKDPAQTIINVMYEVSPSFISDPLSDHTFHNLNC